MAGKDSDLRKIIKERRPGTTDQELDSWGESSDYWGNQNFVRAANWIFQTTKIVSSKAEYANDVIFINLFGTICEIRNFLSEKTQFFRWMKDETGKDTKEFIRELSDSTLREYLEKLAEAEMIVQKISDTFSDDEKFLLGFVRHSYCHPTLSKYMVKMDGFLGTAKLKTAKWERLKKLATKRREDALRDSLIVKLVPHHQSMLRLHFLLLALGGGPA